MNNLVEIRNEDVFTDSLIISKGTGFEHHSITRKIRDYTDEFKELGEIEFMDETSNNPKGGRPQKIYLLNEPQASYLVTLLENNDIVRAFKLSLVKEFYRMRRFLLEKQTAEWKSARAIGKQTRKDETDVIMDKLIPLAEEQGSSNPGMLYMVYSKLVNSILGIKAGMRDNLPIDYIENIRFMERLIENTILEEVKKDTHYKEIYQVCKARCQVVAEMSYLPKLEKSIA